LSLFESKLFDTGKDEYCALLGAMKKGLNHEIIIVFALDRDLGICGSGWGGLCF
jgi:hypothetical protein